MISVFYIRLRNAQMSMFFPEEFQLFQFVLKFSIFIVDGKADFDQ